MRQICRFGSVDSTMRLAAELAETGAPAGTVILAEEQTAGQGRLGRSWHSERGAGLYMTQILRPRLRPESLPVVTLALGLATAEAITRVTGLTCDLRWPNDVLIRERKCAGILAQLSDGVLLAGIGVNVNHAEFPSGIQSLATSLRIEGGREYPVEDLCGAIADGIDAHLSMLAESGTDSVLRAFTQASSYVAGRRVVVEQADGVVRGITDGLDPHGFLYVRNDSGKRIPILAGGVRPECS